MRFACDSVAHDEPHFATTIPSMQQRRDIDEAAPTRTGTSQPRT
jgi:hypothetical protein